MKTRVHITIVVDDLDARNDPERSRRICSYAATDEEIQQLLDMVEAIGMREKRQERYGPLIES